MGIGAIVSLGPGTGALKGDPDGNLKSHISVILLGVE